MKNNNTREINFCKLASFEQEIRLFDTTLEDIQNHFAEDTQMWDFVSYARDSIYRLQQLLHRVDKIDYTSAFEKPSWQVGIGTAGEEAEAAN